MQDALTVRRPDGAFSVFVSRPDVLPAPVVVVLHEIFGVNADLRATCRALSAQGFIAFCPDLFWRQSPGVDLDPADHAAYRRAVALYRSFDFDRGIEDVEAAIDIAVKLPGSNRRVGVMGFCMGGLMTYLAAARLGPDAAVSYYGSNIDNHLDEAGAVRTPLLMHMGDADEYLPAHARTAIFAAFATAPNVEIAVYPGQKHAFARHDGLHYDAASADLAWRRTLAFLSARLC